MNAFEAGERKLIPAVLIYARCGDRILMIEKGASGDGTHTGKWNGLGGKCEANEAPVAAASREFFEEAGLDLPTGRFSSLGWILFPQFKARKNEDWLCFVFTLELSLEESKQVAVSSEEGELRWINVADILGLNLWPGDVHFLSHVFAGTPFTGTIWYENSCVVKHEVTFGY